MAVVGLRLAIKTLRAGMSKGEMEGLSTNDLETELANRNFVPISVDTRKRWQKKKDKNKTQNDATGGRLARVSMSKGVCISKDDSHTIDYQYTK